MIYPENCRVNPTDQVTTGTRIDPGKKDPSAGSKLIQELRS